MTDPAGLRVTRREETILTPQSTARPPFKVSVKCDRCGRTAPPALERWRFAADWADDWVTVIGRRSFRCRCGGAAASLSVSRKERERSELLLEVERSRPGSYAQASGR